MRRNLVAAVALAPLCLAAGRGVALATDTITNGVNAPIATATATNGAPDDIDVSTGSVNISTAAPNAAGITPAITLNSSNNVSNESSISVSGVSNSAAILVDGATGTPFGTVTNSGTITNSYSYSPTTNGNGLNDAPFASPSSSALYGIRVLGPSYVGEIVNSGTITIQGNTSSAISIEAPLLAGTLNTTTFAGDVTNTGTISLTGDNGAAIQSTRAGSIGGNVLIEGAVSALGTNSKAIDLEGDVAGRISIYSTVTATGYASTTRPSDTTTIESVQSTTNPNVTPTLTGAQVQQGGGAVVINGNVGQGIFIGAPPVGTTTATSATQDLDGDGILDVDEGVGSVISYGTAPALTIGNATGANSVIGVVSTSTTNQTQGGNVALPPGSNNDYGVIVRGEVAGEGVYDGVTATGIQVGNGIGANGAAPPTVTIDGGIRVVGSVSADSYVADSTAIHIQAGGVVPDIRNEDFIESSISNSSVTGTNYAGTAKLSAASTGILIDAGANVSAISNFGTLQATANGDAMTAAAVRDLSGSVTNVLNEGVISAVVTPVTSELQLATSSQVALDLSHGSNDETLTQQVNPDPIQIDVSTTTSASGVVTTGASFTTVTSSVTTTTTTTTAGVTTTTISTTPTYPEIVGAVLLGNGANTVNLYGGSVLGALSLGNGNGGSLTLGIDDPSTGTESTAIYQGALTFSGTGLALKVVNGELINTAATPLNLMSLTVGAKGVLYAAIDPSNGGATLYNVSGSATLASGAQLGIVLDSPLLKETTFTIIKAGSLTDLTGGALNTADLPYVLTGTEISGGGAISIDLRTRTPAELGLNPAEASAFGAVYGNIGTDAGIEQALLNTYSKSSFLNVYDQLLPDYSGGVFELALAASDAVTRATSRVNDIENPSGTRGAWAEEVAFGVNHDKDANTAGYQGGGFGFVGGLETGGAGLGAFGLTGSFLTGDIKDPHSPGDNLSSFSEGEFGGYWQAQLGGFRGDARVGGGYLLYANRRELLLTDSAGDPTLDRTSKASSSGYSATGHFGLGYQTGPIGWVYFRPQVRGDYFYLDQGAYTEHGGGVPQSSTGTSTGTTAAASTADGFDLSVAQRNGNEASGVASLVTGMTFGQGFRWRPELEIGYRDVFSGTAGTTVAQFVQGNGQSFALNADDIKGGGPLGRLDVKADTDFYELNFEAGVEDRTHFTEGDLRISVRVLF